MYWESGMGSGSNVLYVYKDKRMGMDGCGCGQVGRKRNTWCVVCRLPAVVSPVHQPPGPVISQAGGDESQTGLRVSNRI